MWKRSGRPSPVEFFFIYHVQQNKIKRRDEMSKGGGKDRKNKTLHFFCAKKHVAKGKRAKYERVVMVHEGDVHATTAIGMTESGRIKPMQSNSKNTSHNNIYYYTCSYLFILIIFSLPLILILLSLSCLNTPSPIQLPSLPSHTQPKKTIHYTPIVAGFGNGTAAATAAASRAAKASSSTAFLASSPNLINGSYL